MLKLSAPLVNSPILSLRSGTTVAFTLRPIINPNNLKIEGFYCQDSIERNRILVLLCQDIREIALHGFVVDDHDVLVEESELVRLQDIMAINFALIGKQVVTVGKQKVGKVNDYAVDTDSMYIKKLYVDQPLYRSFLGGSLSVDRTQIIEVTDKKVIIQEPIQKIDARSSATVRSIA